MKEKMIRGIAITGLSAMLTFAPMITSYAAVENFITHTVSLGESLWKISVQYDTSVQEIVYANSIEDTNNIIVGQHLLIPFVQQSENIVHVVSSGDTLWKIADAYKVSIQDIVELNQLDSNQYLYIGQEITIPTQEEQVPAEETPKQEQQKIHIVESGESIWKISVKYDVSIQDILDANQLVESSTIYVGQELIIPETPPIEEPPSVEEPPVEESQAYITYEEYTVQKGDNLWEISIMHGIPMTELMQENNLTDQSVLNIGQKLTIPVHNIPVMATPGAQYGEYLDWWTQAQYVFPIGARAKVTDIQTGKSYNVIRSYGAFHADCEPLTTEDAAIMYEIWGNKWSWVARAVIIEYDGRKLAASVTNMPHSIQQITDNNFDGHFDIHFLNSTRHKDNLISEDHQEQIKIAAGIGN